MIDLDKRFSFSNNKINESFFSNLSNTSDLMVPQRSVIKKNYLTFKSDSSRPVTPRLTVLGLASFRASSDNEKISPIFNIKKNKINF